MCIQKKINFFWVIIVLYSFSYSAEPNITFHECSLLSPEKIGYIFAHGLGATQEQAALFLATSDHWVINKPAVLFDFPDSKNNVMDFHYELVNLGQKLDIERLDFTLTIALEKLQNHKFILSGISRGASTILNYTALHNNDHIAALVLESPFDTITNVIKHLLKRFHINWIPFSKEIGLKLAKRNFPLLNINGIFPLDVVHKIPSHIPILIIHTKHDKTISINSSRSLYKALLLSGHANTYLLELASGDHGKLILGPEADLYKCVVHAFYKKFNLPYNNAYAQRGQTMLLYCQPTLEEITKRIQKNRFNMDDMNDDEFGDEQYLSRKALSNSDLRVAHNNWLDLKFFINL